MIRAVFLSFLLITGCASTTQQIDGAYFDNLFSPAFFAETSDPFQEMHRIAEVEAASTKEPKRYRNTFNAWYWDRYGQYPAENIHYREDDSAFYVTLDVDANDNPTVNLKMVENVLMISGQLIRKSRYSERRLRLQQNLPVPDGLNPTSMFSWKNGEDFIIRIDKLETTS
jgi:HSP20 family molecular chaperone IbpA